MHVDDLNMKVTAAILTAQRCADGTEEFRDAYRDVAFAEEALAICTEAGSVEGEVCRCGAVTAALRARMPYYAHALALKYLAQGLAPGMRVRMEQLRKLALDEIGEDDA